MYYINLTSKTPLHIQLYNEIKNDIINNYKAKDKLPSLRKVASLYNLSKNTVESAYSQLVVEGYIQNNYKSAYTVTNTIFDNFNSNYVTNSTQEEQTEPYLYDFFPARLSKDSFPLKLWKRLFTKVIDDTLDFGAYSCGQGEFGLRVEIAKYINQSRGVKCQAGQIIVCGGFADSLSLLAKMIHKNYDTLAMENPGYHIIHKVFDSYGYNIKKINLNENGLILDDLKKSKAKLIFTTPSHQYPTGIAMPLQNRVELLLWAKENNALIIEDDYDSELAYTNRPIPSLQGLDINNTVVYLGTFSKSLSPALRVSYMVLPNHLINIYKTHFDFNVSRVSLMVQKTLEIFMKEGHWDRHLRKIRTLNKKKHNLMKKLLEEKLGSSMRIESQGGGLAILINPTTKFDWEKLKEKAKEEKIKLYFAKEKSGGEWEAIRMGFGGFTESEIKKAIEIFSNIWFQCIVKEKE
jgi:GntR family transcriptional regulator/MocR family aminotransferase